MKKPTRTALLLLAGTFVILLAVTFVLPSQIPFHFNAKGEAGWYASKYFILCLTPVPYLIYWQFKRNKK
ncbi:DUF1648 domain-containing protein [Paenibacillus campinasensis]|uniref:DUF1648 domain-containing protein n=1 Tax=Paenibacillus campinasensis TaxID=66347 RepID=A0A268ETS4_9BACL|nr:DUF1648 domain-containing protein [Paenibacillus campinasensis]PAD76474.1 hypothetical protein CHH67_12730 [Paenibacillus campinasensis]